MSSVSRIKSIDKVNTPEDLSDYMRVTNPPVWFALAAVILFLVGSVFWGMTAKLETKATAVAVGEGEDVICYISADDIAEVKTGTVVRIGKTEYTVTDIDSKTLQADAVLSDYEMSLADFKNGETVYAVFLGGEMITSSSAADVILEEISPITFLFGSSD